MRACLAGLAVVAACAPAPNTPTPPAPAPRDDLHLWIERPEAEAMDLLESLALKCWRDGIVGGVEMLVDRGSKRVIIVSDSERLLDIGFATRKPDRSQIRLNGPAARDPDQARQMARTLDRANRTGETSCPRR